MPRPESPEGKWLTFPVRVRESLMAQIDVARGERNRSEWAREALQSAVGSPAPKTVTPAPDGVPAVAFQEPAEPAPEPRQTAACKHPGVGRKQRCRECGAFNV